MNRAISYFNNDQCHLAISDAKTALTREPGVSPGLHTSVEVSRILATCLALEREYEQALEFIESAISLAMQHEYSDETIAGMVELRDLIFELQ